MEILKGNIEYNVYSPTQTRALDAVIKALANVQLRVDDMGLTSESLTAIGSHDWK